MAAVLIRKGLVSKVDEALQRIKSIRPGIALEKQQIVLLKIWLQQNPAPDSCPKKKACPGAHGSPEA
jgi:protein-tyrosine phosphatase